MSQVVPTPEHGPEHRRPAVLNEAKRGFRSPTSMIAKSPGTFAPSSCRNLVTEYSAMPSTPTAAGLKSAVARNLRCSATLSLGAAVMSTSAPWLLGGSCRSFGRQHDAAHGHVVERHRYQILHFKRNDLFEFCRIAERKR